MGGMYEGMWKNDRMHGKGRLYGPNDKLIYDGEFVDEKFHGIGVVYND